MFVSTDELTLIGARYDMFILRGLRCHGVKFCGDMCLIPKSLAVHVGVGYVHRRVKLRLHIIYFCTPRINCDRQIATASIIPSQCLLYPIGLFSDLGNCVANILAIPIQPTLHTH